MSVTPGSTIGPYSINREIGRGGMGVVYLGLDTRLDREVAIKALPPALAADAERLDRFQREARALARLNHSNIATIYGFEEHKGSHYLVMEHVEGTTLGEQLRSGPLPVDIAFDYASQIASGVEAAHDAGVIHRDLKPDNIRVTPDGHIKVLDFGLARTAESGSSTLVTSQSPTVTSPDSPTLPGVILGTAPYMSPEQARGRRVDKRSDVWSFGVILYEMLTGVSPFVGETVTDSIAAVLHKEIDLDALPPRVGSSGRRVIELCLQRDPANRLRDVGDARLQLQTGVSDPLAKPAQSRSGLLATLIVVLALALIAVTWALVRSGGSPTPTARTPIAFSIDLPDGAYINQDMSLNEIAISPDGTTIAYVVFEENGESNLYLRRLEDRSARRVQGLRSPRGPRFSPDGSWVVVREASERLTRIPVKAGPSQLVLDLGDSFGLVGDGLLWREANELIVCSEDGEAVRRVNIEDGTHSVICRRAPEDGVWGIIDPIATSNTSGILVGSWSGPRRRDNNISWLDLESGRLTRVIENANMPRPVGNRWLTFVRDGSIYAVAFDFERVTPTATEHPVLAAVATNEWSDSTAFDLSRNGIAVYMPGGRRGENRRMLYVEPDGTTTPAVERPGAFTQAPVMSPNGQQIAYTTLQDQMELWLRDVHTGATTRHRLDGEIYSLLFSPEGDSLYFRRRASGLPELVRFDLDTETVQSIVERTVAPAGWTPDGHLIGSAISPVPGNRDWDIVVVDVESGEVETHIGQPEFEWDPCLSPDGQWLLYRAHVAGQTRIHLRSFPDGSRDWIVTTGADAPRWSHDGTTIYYTSFDGMAAITARSFDVGDDGPVFGPETKIFESPSLRVVPRFDVTPDGRFLIIDAADWEKQQPPLNVVVNWDVEIERLFAGK